jgi:hypothetical protein
MGGHGFSPQFCPEAPVIEGVLLSTRDLRTATAKKPEEAMEILEAYDLTGSLRGAAALAGCDHKTVARPVAAREEAGGGLPVRARSRSLVDPFVGKIDELVDRSRAQIRADKAHGVLVAMGYEGSYRTTCPLSASSAVCEGSRIAGAHKNPSIG